MTLSYLRYKFEDSLTEYELVKEMEFCYDWYVAGKFIGQVSQDQLWRYTKRMTIMHSVYEED